VVLPASGCEMMAKVRRRRVSERNDKMESGVRQGLGPRILAARSRTLPTGN
jgi:hypothetical protein